MTLQDQLEPGESLLPGQSKVSNGNVTRLDFKSDGNLVLTNMQTGQQTWSSNTRGSGAATLSMNGDGSLALLDGQGNSIWSVGPMNIKKAHLVVQDDGNLVIYKDNKTDSKHAVWSSQTSGGQTNMQQQSGQMPYQQYPGSLQSAVIPPPAPGMPYQQQPMGPMGPMGQPGYPHHHQRHHHNQMPPQMAYPQQNPHFNGELDWSSTKKASVMVGATTGVIAAVAGAPLWGAVLVGSGGTLMAPKIIDFVTKLVNKIK